MPTNYPGVDTSWITNVPIVVDGDEARESILRPAWERCADREAYLHRVCPKIYTYSNDGGNPYFSLTSPEDGPLLTSTVGGKIDIAGCAVGDKIHVMCSFDWRLSASNQNKCDVWLERIDDYGVTNSQGHIAGGKSTFKKAGSGGGNDGDAVKGRVCLQSVWTVVTAGTTRITLWADGDEAEGTPGTWFDFRIENSFSLTVVHYPKL